MKQRKRLRRILAANACILALCSPALAENFRLSSVVLLPVTSVESRSATWDLASRTAGTRLFQGTMDGGWKPVDESMDSTGVNNLLSVDPAAVAAFQGGEQDFLFEFADLQRVNRLALRQQGRGGAVEVFGAEAPYAPDSPRWQKLASSAAEMSSDPLVNLEFPPASMRFLRVSFDYPEGAEVGSVFLGSDVVIEDGEATISPPELWPTTADLVDFDFSRLAAGGRIAYVGSSNAVGSNHMLDGDPTTFFEFDKSEQGAFFIVRLAEAYPIHQVSISKMHAIRSFETWAFTDYPDEILKEDPNGEGLKIISGDSLAERPPLRRVDVPESEETTFLTVPLPETTARYLLVRVVGKSADQPVRVTDFSVLGRVPREYVAPQIARASNTESSRSEADPSQGTDPPRIPFASP